MSIQKGGGPQRMEIYPLTITADRYTGSYSKGEYLAWKLDHWEVPKEPFMDDITCMVFWNTYNGLVGIGDTPEAAVKDLESKLMKWAMELHGKYGWAASWWIEAVELCEDEESAREYVVRRSKQTGRASILEAT